MQLGDVYQPGVSDLTPPKPPHAVVTSNPQHRKRHVCLDNCPRPCPYHSCSEQCPKPCKLHTCSGKCEIGDCEMFYYTADGKTKRCLPEQGISSNDNAADLKSSDVENIDIENDDDEIINKSQRSWMVNKGLRTLPGDLLVDKILKMQKQVLYFPPRINGCIDNWIYL